MNLAPNVALTQLLTIGVYALLAGMTMAWTWAYARLREGRPLLPKANPRIVPWRSGTISVLFAVWVLVNFATVHIYLRLSHHPRGQELSLTELMTLLSLINAAIIVLVPLVLRITSRATLADLGLCAGGVLGDVKKGGVAFLLVAIPIYCINFLSAWLWAPKSKHPIERMVLENPTGGVIYLAVLSAVILAPLAEEMLFRGVLQPWIYRTLRQALTHWVDRTERSAPVAAAQSGGADSGQLVATREEDDSAPGATPKAPATVRPEQLAGRVSIVMTSAVFALAHSAQWPAPIALFFLSLVLGWLYQNTSSLWPPITLHALFNGLSTSFLMLAMLNGGK